MDIEQFDKLSGQFQHILDQLQLHGKNLQQATAIHPLAETEYLSDCAAQMVAEKHLRTLADDIHALGTYYNHLRESIQLSRETFDALE